MLILFILIYWVICAFLFYYYALNDVDKKLSTYLTCILAGGCFVTGYIIGAIVDYILKKKK